MAGRRIFTWMARILGLLAGIVIAGDLSSVLSLRSAEQAAANLIAVELDTHEIFVVADEPWLEGDAARSTEVLTRAGFAVRQCPPTTGVFKCFPWAGVGRATVIGPFVVEVKRAAASGGLSGYGRRTRYLGLFGFVVHIRDVGGLVS